MPASAQSASASSRSTSPAPSPSSWIACCIALPLAGPAEPLAVRRTTARPRAMIKDPPSTTTASPTPTVPANIVAAALRRHQAMPDASPPTRPAPAAARSRWTTVSRLVRSVAAFQSAGAGAAGSSPPTAGTRIPRTATPSTPAAHPMLLPDDPADREFAAWRDRRAARAWLAAALAELGLDADSPAGSALASRRHVEPAAGTCAWGTTASLASVLVHLVLDPTGCGPACALHANAADAVTPPPSPGIAPPSAHELARVAAATAPVDAVQALAEYYAHAEHLPATVARALGDVNAALRDLAPPPPPYAAVE
ncbi:hypothetical protein H9P43_003040 [Blastocladiella emersonii ATCC 22665]|nr:hypothetical protein H9P43_003040 [Blastocladiella emersonii ATCC 22665]